MIATLEELKRNLRIDSIEEDEFLLDTLEAAESMTLTNANRQLEELTDGDRVMAKRAILLLASTWYENRSSVSFGNPRIMPHGYEMLVRGFAKIGVH